MKNEKQVNGHHNRFPSETKVVISLSELEAILSGDILAIQASYDEIEKLEQRRASEQGKACNPYDTYHRRCDKAKMVLKLTDQRLKLEAARMLQSSAAVSTEGGAV